MPHITQLCLFLLFLVVGLVLSCKKEAEQPTPPQTGSAITANPTVTGLITATVTADASGSNYTITVPAGTDVKILKIAIPLAAGATINPDPTQAHDYTNPVSYTITKADGTKQTVTVKVVVQPAPVTPKSSEKQITAFTFATLTPAISASIDQSAHKIIATVPTDADLTKLVPTIILSAKATVSPASGVAQNFSSPVNYTVTAEDGSSQTYEMKVDKQTTIIPTGSCLISRIDNTDTKEYATFQYDIQGRVIKMEGAALSPSQSTTTLTPFTISFTYNASGDLLEAQKGNSSYKLSYQSGKLVGFESINQITSTKQNIVVNESNQIIQISDNSACINLIYSNKSLIKFMDCNTSQVFVELEYSGGKHFLYSQNSRPGWLYAFNTAFPLSGGSYRYDNTTYYYYPLQGTVLSQNSPNKITNNFTLIGLTNKNTFSYKFNNEGFPTEMQIIYEYDSKVTSAKQQTFNYRLTYTNCQ